MSDYISRKAAIDALGEKPLVWTQGEYELGLQNQWQSDVDVLKALPSVQPDLQDKCDGCFYVNNHGACDFCMRNFPDRYSKG